MYVRSVLGAVLLATLVVACGVTDPGPAVSSVSVVPKANLLVGVGDQVGLAATPLDAGGTRQTGQTIEWSSSDTTVVVVGASGLVRSISAGTVMITASAGDVSGTATVEVFIPPVVNSYTPGQIYLGREGYAEYHSGTLPIIIMAPHGGDLEPDEIPDRTYGVVAADRNTRQLGLSLADALEARLGRRPHVIINRLHRRKLDANREIVEAAQESPFAEQAWAEFHGFIDVAKATVTADTGWGLALDMHGHGHPIQRMELGYLLSSAKLNAPDSELNPRGAETSLRSLSQSVNIPFSQLIRGPKSLGTLLAAGGYRAVPSTGETGPDSDPFFSGGYDTRRHGSRDGGVVDAIQLEHYFVGVRDTEGNRMAYATVLAEVVELFLAEHYGFSASQAPR